MCLTDLSVCGEVKLRVQQNLLSSEASLADVTRIYSHAQSLAQCVHWLATHLPSVPRVAVSSNAEAARLAAAEPGTAAIAGENAAAIYGLSILAPHIEDEPNNTTRFWVLGRQKVGASGRDETSLVMSCPNRPGAVYQLLEPLARHDVSMTRFESRPARTGLWEYLFFVDLVGHRDDPKLSAALGELADEGTLPQAARFVSGGTRLIRLHDSRPLLLHPPTCANSRATYPANRSKTSLVTWISTPSRS